MLGSHGDPTCAGIHWGTVLLQLGAMGTSSATGAAILGIVSVQAVFAGYQLLGKLILRGGLDPIAFALLREVSASSVFLVASACVAPRSSWPQPKHLGRFVLCGASMFGNVFLNVWALTMTSPSIVALLQPTQPIFASILATCLKQEHMTGRKAIGILLCVAGGASTVLQSGGSGGPLNWGSLVVLAQCASGANYVVQQRPLVHAGYSPLIVSSCSYVIASLFTVVVGLVYFLAMPADDRQDIQWWDSSPFFAAVLLYCVLLTTVYNYVMIAWVTGKLGATVVTLFTLCQGIFACGAELALFGTPILPMQFAGATAIFSGLFVVVCAPVAAPSESTTSYVDTRETWAAAVISGHSPRAECNPDMRVALRNDLSEVGHRGNGAAAEQEFGSIKEVA